jgi:hypothetical protein
MQPPIPGPASHFLQRKRKPLQKQNQSNSNMGDNVRVQEPSGTARTRNKESQQHGQAKP